MDPKQWNDLYWYSTIGFGETKSFKSLKYAIVKIDLIDCVAKIVDGQIVEPTMRLPYCFISGRNKIVDETVTIAIVNKVDFRNAWKIEEEFWEYDCYLEYKPTRFMSKLFPQFEFSIFPRGHDSSTSVPLFCLKGFDAA